MKKLLMIVMIVCGIGFAANAQSPTSKEEELKVPRYQLFKTQNMWTFLKLDTMTGKIWQVQYSVEGSQYRFETALDINTRVSEYYDDPIYGRFTLYPTDNMFNFILLDQMDGRCWQVQWSTEPENRGVMRIR